MSDIPTVKEQADEARRWDAEHSGVRLLTGDHFEVRVRYVHAAGDRVEDTVYVSPELDQDHPEYTEEAAVRCVRSVRDLVTNRASR